MNWASGLLYICQTDQEDCYHQEDRTVGTHAHPRPHAPTKRASVHILFKQNKIYKIPGDNLFSEEEGPGN